MNRSKTTNNRKPLFDATLAKKLIGKHVIVGLSQATVDGTIEHQTQFHGTIIEASKAGVAIEISNSGIIYWLPPDLRPFKKAAKGTYRLRDTGEVVIDPDYTAAWITDDLTKIPLRPNAFKKSIWQIMKTYRPF